VPHIVLFAFLQRVINGGGQVRREFAVGNDSADIIIEMPYIDPAKPGVHQQQREVIEVKLYRTTNTAGWQSFVKEGKEQIVDKCLRRLQVPRGYLVIWDQKAAKKLSDKRTARKAAPLAHESAPVDAEPKEEAAKKATPAAPKPAENNELYRVEDVDHDGYKLRIITLLC
jgi:hypothetical protein